MNVKITATSVTFKITEEELNLLDAGHIITTTTPIGSHNSTMTIAPYDAGEATESSHKPLKLIYDTDKSGITLHAARTRIRTLVNMGRSKEGLYDRIEALDVYLQVDLKTDSRPRKKSGAGHIA